MRIKKNGQFTRRFSSSKSIGRSDLKRDEITIFLPWKKIKDRSATVDDRENTLL